MQVVRSSPALLTAVAAAVVGVVTPACVRPRPRGVETVLAVLPAESDAFPAAAEATTRALTDAEVPGIARRRLSDVSLEVVQLSIECLEPTPACFAAVGRSLSAGQLLFAQLAKGPRRREVTVTVTLFDVPSEQPRTTAKVFPTERAAVAGVTALVEEVTRAPAEEAR